MLMPLKAYDEAGARSDFLLIVSQMNDPAMVQKLLREIQGEKGKRLDEWKRRFGSMALELCMPGAKPDASWKDA